MTSKTPFQRRLMAVPTAAALLAVILTACGSDSSGDLGATPIDQQSTTNVDVQINGDLPAGFPADDVPLINGEIVTAGGTEEEGIWIVVIRSTDSTEGARAEAIGLLTAAGYTESDDMAGMGVYTDGVYTVMVRAGEPDGYTVLNYSIATE